MKKVYFSHAYGNKKSNYEHITRELTTMVNLHAGTLELMDIFPISPINALSFAYSGFDYTYGIGLCLELLSQCELMIIFRGFENSNGVDIEKAYCLEHNIDIIYYDEFIKMLNDFEKAYSIENVLI